MKNQIFWAIYKKEWREILPVWLAVALGGFCLLLFNAFVWMLLRSFMGLTSGFLANVDYLLVGSYSVFLYLYIVSALTFSRETEENGYQLLRRMPVSSAMIFKGKIWALIHSTFAMTGAIAILYGVIFFLFGNNEYATHRVFYLGRLCTGVPLGCLIGLYSSLHCRKQWNALITGAAFYVIIDLNIMPPSLPIFEGHYFLKLLCDPFRIGMISCLILMVHRYLIRWFDLVESEDKSLSIRRCLSFRKKKNDKISPEKIKRPSEWGALFRWTFSRFRREFFWFFLCFFILAAVCLWGIISYGQYNHFSILKQTVLYKLVLFPSAILLMIYWILLTFIDLNGQDSRLLMNFGICPIKLWLVRILLFGTVFGLGFYIFAFLPFDRIYGIPKGGIRIAWATIEYFMMSHKYISLAVAIFAAGVFCSASLKGLALSLVGFLFMTVPLGLITLILPTYPFYEMIVMTNYMTAAFLLVLSCRSLRIRLKSSEMPIFKFRILFYAILYIISGILIFPKIVLIINPTIPEYQVKYSRNLISMDSLSDSNRSLSDSNFDSKTNINPDSKPLTVHTAFEDSDDRVGKELKHSNGSTSNEAILSEKIFPIDRRLQSDRKLQSDQKLQINQRLPIDRKLLAIPLEIEEGEQQDEGIRRENELIRSLFRAKGLDHRLPSDGRPLNSDHYFWSVLKNRTKKILKPSELAQVWEAYLLLYRETAGGYLANPGEMSSWITFQLQLYLENYDESQLDEARTLLERIPKEMPSFTEYYARLYSRLYRFSLSSRTDYVSSDPFFNSWGRSFLRHPDRRRLYRRLLWNTIQKKLELTDFLFFMARGPVKDLQSIKELELIKSGKFIRYEDSDRIAFQCNNDYHNQYLNLRFPLNGFEGFYWCTNIWSSEVYRRAMLIQLAFRRYVKDHHEPPELLSQLTEKGYLKELPKPPLTPETSPGFVYSVKLPVPEKQKVEIVILGNWTTSQEIMARYQIPVPNRPQITGFGSISYQMERSSGCYSKNPAIFDPVTGFWMEFK